MYNDDTRDPENRESENNPHKMIVYLLEFSYRSKRWQPSDQEVSDVHWRQYTARQWVHYIPSG